MQIGRCQKILRIRAEINEIGEMKTYAHRNTCMQMLIVALFILAPTGNNTNNYSQEWMGFPGG